MRTHRNKDLASAQQEVSQQPPSTQQSKEPKKGSSNPFLKFLQDSGSWIAEKYKQTTNSLGQTAQNVGNAASDLWDVVTNTNLSFSKGGLDGETDLDEVLDIIPGDIGVLLDRDASDNKAKFHFAKDGSITIHSDSLAIGAVDINGFKLSNAMLKGVRVHIRRERNGLIPTINPDESQITIDIASAIGQNVCYTKEKGPVTAKEVELFNLHVVTTGKQAPFDDTPAGNLTFSVGSAVIRGFNGMNASADSLSVQNSGGSLSQEQGNIHSASASTAGLLYQGNSVDNAQLAGLNASFQSQSNGEMGAQVTAASASAHGIDTAKADVDHVEAHNIALTGNKQGGSIDASSLALDGLDTEFVDIDSFSSSQLHASGNMGEQSFSGSTGSFSASGVHNGNASLGSAYGTGLSVARDIDDKTGSFQADSLGVNNVQSQHGSVDSAHINKIALQSAPGLSSGSMDSAGAHGVSSRFGSVQDTNINGLSFQSDGKNHSASMQGASIAGGQSDFGTVDAASLSNVVVASDGKNHSGSIGTTSLTNGTSVFGGIGQATLQNTTMKSDGTNHAATVGSGQGNALSFGKDSVQDLSISEMSVASDGKNHSATLDSIQANNINVDGMASIESIEGNKLKAKSGTNGQHASIGTVAAKGIDAGSVSMQQANAHSLSAGRSTDGAYTNVGEAFIQGANISQNSSQMGINSTLIKNAGIRQDAAGTNVHMDKGSVSGISAHLVGSDSQKQNSGTNLVDIDALIASSAARVESGNIQASAKLNRGDIGPASIKNDTGMSANIQIANNHIQNGSNITTDKKIDGPLWTSVSGAYVKDGEMMGDVNGFFDMNVSKSINKGMGLDGKKLHSIGEYGAAIANKPSSGNTSSSASPIDASSIKANGNIQLSNGSIDAGAASAQLSGTEKGDNNASFSLDKGNLALEFARFLTSSLSIKTDTLNMESDSASVSGGSLSIQPDKKKLDGTIGNIQVEGVQAQFNK